MSIDYKIIGQRIKSKRIERNMTQEELSEKLGVSVGYISQLERGITRINLDTLSNISLELNCDITGFLTDVTITGKNFLNTDIMVVFESMNDIQRKMLLEIAEIIKNNS